MADFDPLVASSVHRTPATTGSESATTGSESAIQGRSLPRQGRSLPRQGRDHLSQWDVGFSVGFFTVLQYNIVVKPEQT